MKINFKNSDYLPGEDTPALKKAKDYLNALPDGDVISTRDLKRVSPSAEHNSASPTFKDFRHKIGSKLWWGNPATIKALRKQVQ